MKNGANIMDSLARLEDQCNAGYAIALHISFTTPRFLFQTYSKVWMDMYSEKGLVLKDPTVLWGFSNTGIKRWCDLEELDENDVLPLAREHGLNYGFTFSTDQNDSRSIASFARSDRDFSGEEMEEISNDVSSLHSYTEKISDLSDDELQQLKNLSVSFTRG